MQPARCETRKDAFPNPEFQTAKTRAAHAITSAEDAQGNLPFAHVTLRETRLLYNRWLAANPEFVRWWEYVVEEWKQKGFLLEPFVGRRRDFADLDLEEIRNEIINYKAQACAASVVNKATISLIEGPLPFGRWGPNTGIIQQGHDALLAEVPQAYAKMVAQAMKDSMTMRVPGRPDQRAGACGVRYLRKMMSCSAAPPFRSTAGR